MISSRKFDFIAILLTALVLVGVIIAMLLPNNIFTGNEIGTFVYGNTHSVSITEDDYYTNYTDSPVAKISLNSTYAETDSRSVEINGSEITILGGGVYILSGTLDDGSLIVDAADGAEVRLVLNGVQISSSDFAAIYIKQAGKTVISLVEGTENRLSDGSSYNEEKTEEGKPSAALYSKDDLTINGKGSLSVSGNYQDGIKANDVLKITEASMVINAVDEGINANDSIAVFGAQLTVTSGGDAIKCEHEDAEKGFAVLENVELSAVSEEDGIWVSSALYINGGSFDIDSADDAVHSDGDVTVESGKFAISAGDDAVHAGMNLVLNPESIDISKCYEGLEGAYITINGGDIRIISSDDGINASGENSMGGMGMMRGGFGGAEKTEEKDIWLTVNDGHIYIETSGDGFDSNGSAVINGGYLEIYGPENSGNGSIDVGDGGYVLIMNGGSLLAAGSSGMAEHPSESSPQKSLTFYLDETYSADSSISVIDSSGNEIISGNSNKKFDWICMSTETLTEGEVYTLIINGNETASITADGAVATSGRGNGDMGRGGMSRSGNFERRQQ